LRVLLDTHALLWAFLDHPQLSKAAREAIASDDNENLVSAVSAMEIALKHRLGKLAEATPFLRNGMLAIERLDHTPLAVTIEHGSLAGSMDIPHKDPFDRLLIAQARIEQVPIVSNERLFDRCGVERIW
jgi:PIN domain nuclease of toxin-antitoxin system